MTITSIKFLLFLIISLIIYYTIPRKNKWIILLLSSIFFFLTISNWKLLIVLLFSITVSYLGAKIIDTTEYKHKKLVYILTIILIILPLFLIKYFNILPMTINLFGDLFNINFGIKTINLIAPLGISYYSLNLIGYVTDIYWKKNKYQKNYFKFILFGCYYPIILSGPFIRYSLIKDELYNEKKLNWNNIYCGFIRIIYGLLKKLVIADLLYSFVQFIFNDYTTFNGIYIVIAVICYAIQIYCDFSGCMDIVIGASQMYNIKLPENFKSPFYSKNLSEFWRRWHITLGLWGKDYIMYPILKTNLFQKLGITCRKKFGKKIGKKIPTILAILILWLIIGLWHGTSYKYIFAAGILPWFYLTFSEFTKDIFGKMKLNYDNIYIKILQIIKTFLLMCFLWLFVCSPSLTKSLDVISNIFVTTDLNNLNQLPILPYNIIFKCLILVGIVDYFKYKDINVLEKIRSLNIILRYLLLLVMINIILIYGSYGPAYNPVDFIYGGF